MRGCNCPTCRILGPQRLERRFWRIVNGSFSAEELHRLDRLVDELSTNQALRDRLAAYSRRVP